MTVFRLWRCPGDPAAVGAIQVVDYSPHILDRQIVAEVLNAFNIDDILARLAKRSVDNLMEIENGAWRNPRVGKNSQIALVTHDLVAAVYPQAYSPGAVFPNNFGDRLGGVGGLVVAAAGGVLAVRLAAPLLINYWRQITLTSGMAKIAAEAEMEEAEVAAMDLEAAVHRLRRHFTWSVGGDI
ncbi:hypothetical protein [Streptomyces swartbergensis]|uniref:hypothetical protein n=1 Tax=Streptomyces swartbergensis TaxID=487165 RepID=UPI00382D49E1